MEKSCRGPRGVVPKASGASEGATRREPTLSILGQAPGAGTVAAPHLPHPHFCADLAGDSHSKTQREASEEAERRGEVSALTTASRPQPQGAREAPGSRGLQPTRAPLEGR